MFKFELFNVILSLLLIDPVISEEERLVKFLNWPASSALDSESVSDIGQIMFSKWFWSLFVLFPTESPAIAPNTDDVSVLFIGLLFSFFLSLDTSLSLLTYLLARVLAFPSQLSFLSFFLMTILNVLRYFVIVCKC